ncbi:hypothetical protein ABW19_dt0205370 [Dactylella cylindrospora]|nr:hypothetical protein ABW19_dt0205370 [Dactylella cylindrospora]
MKQSWIGRRFSRDGTKSAEPRTIKDKSRGVPSAYQIGDEATGTDSQQQQHWVESVDGNDFHKHVAQISLENTAPPREQLQHEALPRPSIATETSVSSFSTATTENTESKLWEKGTASETSLSSGSSVPYEHSSRGMPVPSRGRYRPSGHENASDRGTTTPTSESQASSQSRQTETAADVPRPPPQIPERRPLPISKPMPVNHPPIPTKLQNDFIKYLSDGAMKEIIAEEADKAKPYIERLKTIPGSEATISALNQKIYTLRAAKAVTAIQKNSDTTLAFEFLSEFGYGVETYDSVGEVSAALVEYYQRRSESLMASSKWLDSYEMIKEINRKTRGVYVSHKLEANLIERMKSEFFNLETNTTRTDIPGVELKGMGKLVARLYDMAISAKFLELFWSMYPSEAYEVGIQVSEALLKKTGKTDSVLSSGHRIMNTILSGVFCHGFRDPVLARFGVQYFFNVPPLHLSISSAYLRDYGRRRYPATIKIDELVNLTLRWIHQLSLGRKWSNTLELAEHLRRLFKNETLGTQGDNEGTILKCHIQCRCNLYAEAGCRISTISEDKVSELSDDYQFLYYLTRAEVAYFEDRNMEDALKYGQQAAGLDGCSWYNSLREDAIYLVFRVLTRMSLTLDADFYYSLIPPDYDQWRIYGEGGKLLCDAGIVLDKGELFAGDAAFARLLKYGGRGQFGRRAIAALCADGVNWTLKHFSFETEVAGMWSVVSYYARQGFLTGLKIILHNPWVNVNMEDMEGWTPLHEAADNCSDVEIFKLLVGAGGSASINVVSSAGYKPLQIILLRWNKPDPIDPDIFPYLLDAGADASSVDSFGELPLERLTAALREVVQKDGPEALLQMILLRRYVLTLFLKNRQIFKKPAKPYAFDIRAYKRMCERHTAALPFELAAVEADLYKNYFEPYPAIPELP